MTITDGKRRHLHRLIYRTLPQVTGQIPKSPQPQHALKFEMELPAPLFTELQATQALENTLKLKEMSLSDELHSSVDSVSSQGGVSHSGTEAVNQGWGFNCQVGKEIYVNLMLPDRSVCHL